jgi:hypothetical protein
LTAKARWVLGGSCCLALHGVKLTPHDIDIITDPDGAYRIGESLQKMTDEKRAVAWGEGQLIRSHRGIYWLREGEDWVPPGPPSEWKIETLTLPGSELNVTAFTLEHERDANHQLQRDDKVRLIEEQLAMR